MKTCAAVSIAATSARAAEPELRKPTVPPAMKDIRAPRIKLPAGTCDCHAHIFGPQATFPYLPDAAYIPPDQTLDDYVRIHKTLGVQRGVLVQPSVYGTDHAAMIAAMKSGKFNFRGVAVTAPDVTQKQIEEFHQIGFRGIRINLASKNRGLSIDDAPRLARLIKPLGWHLQFYAPVGAIAAVEEKFTALPVNLVIDHFGVIDCAAGMDSPDFKTLLRLLARPNVWMKLSGPYHVSKKSPLAPDVTPFALRIVEAAPDRLVWGTDWPHPTAPWMPNDADLADMLLDWIPDEATRKKILVDNPARLYDFG
ncbi:MAG TPA: amidohydrolase family protein [Humisphaera sp.]|nr:amidohydrolase family protein [Humisphaera sp.]